MSNTSLLKKKLGLLALLAFVIIFGSFAFSSTLNNCGTQKEAISAKAVSKPPSKDKIDETLRSLMDKHGVPGVSLAIIKNDILDETRTYGVVQSGSGQKINEETVFSVGSVSKVVAALVTLKLVDEGRLSLDEDINTYLKSWKVKESDHTRNNPVTLRRILSHTAGFTVHGFADYLPDESLPSTLQILEGTGPAKNNRVYVNAPVGSRFKYSGGGITVEQLLLEDVTGLPIHKAAEQVIFQPLDLKRSSFENPLPSSFEPIAKAHNGNGKAVALPRGYQSMPEAAASGLWTTPSDLATIVTSLLTSLRNEKSTFLSQEIVTDMITPVALSEFGLGPKIERVDGETVFYHNGANDSYRAYFKVFSKKGSGYVIFTNGSNGGDLIQAVKSLLDEYVN